MVVQEAVQTHYCLNDTSWTIRKWPIKIEEILMMFFVMFVVFFSFQKVILILLLIFVIVFLVLFCLFRFFRQVVWNSVWEHLNCWTAFWTTRKYVIILKSGDMWHDSREVCLSATVVCCQRNICLLIYYSHQLCT